MSVVPEPHKWDMIPYTAGTLVCERKNELLEGLFFLFFLFHKNYIGMTWDGQEGNVPHPTARSCR
ncbi:hypothetical protein D7V90_18175 [bacterium 1xD42-87]|nr:hypothetical protein D7V90_18175 [bacterium 1xD42-87]